MSVDITVLGGFSVVVAGLRVQDRAWRRRAASDLVKLLALSEGRALHREQVIDALWPRHSPDAALPRLHQAAHYARGALGLRDGVVLRRDRVALLPDGDVRVDAAEFRRRGERALAARSAQAAAEVLERHPGELLPEDLYADWAAAHRESFDALRTRLSQLAGRTEDSDAPARPALAGAAHQGRSRGLLLVIDDLAGADAASLRMLHHVAASITARGIGRVVELG
jgi:DNA-binding SARP family transcriptional activator